MTSTPSASFYRALGLHLFENNEPSFPRHYDGGVGGTAVQLFLVLDRPYSRVQLGFRVAHIREVAARLDELGFDYNLTGPHRLSALDPDGNRVHVTDVGEGGDSGTTPVSAHGMHLLHQRPDERTG